MLSSVVHANCLRFPYAAVGAHVQIVDPPFSAKVHAKATSTRTGGVGVQKRDLGFDHLSTALLMQIARYATQVERWTVVFSDHESTHLWRAAMALHGVEYVREVPWIRWSQPQVTGDRPPSAAESILLFHNTRRTKRGRVHPIKKHWNGPGNRMAYRSEDLEPIARTEYGAKSLRGDEKEACEKPFDLMLAIVSDYSDPGELILDTCACSGATVLAARTLGREALGLELRADVAARAEARLRAGVLTPRELERLERWYTETVEEASQVPTPKCPKGSDVKTWERAQRRLADVERAGQWV